MKQLKIFSLLLISAALFLVACNKTDPTNLILMSTSVSVGYDGGQENVSFMTNHDWTVQSSETWASVAPTYGSASASTQTVKVTVPENPGATERKAYLTISAGNVSKQVAVVQAGMPAATLTLKTDAVTLESKAGSAQVSFQTNRGWTASSDAAWLEVSPASGEGSTQYQTLTLTAQENTGENAREAKVRIQAGDKSAEVSVTQLVGAQLTISAFKSKPANTTTWYRLTGEIAAIENEEYGNFFLFDETGFVYVYGLSKTQVSKNDQTFKQLGLKVGDKLTMMTLRSEHEGMAQAGGDTPAYFVSSTPGEYKLGRKVASTKAAWMELPATKADDGQDLLIHSFPDGKRSYAAYYDYDHFVSTWVAYPLCSGNIGSGDRTEKFTLDPILPRDKQQYLPKGYRTGNGSSNERFDRGHQIASADRLDYRVNLETFFGTNMTPQDHTLNTDLWGTLEQRVRGWAKKSDTDTLYVVTGCVVEGSTKYVLDSDNKHITVPVGYYKALLRLAKDKSYSAVGFWFDNKSNSAPSVQKSMSMSIDDLEKKVGVDFFVNLPADVQASVEAQNPADVDWWWNN